MGQMRTMSASSPHLSHAKDFRRAFEGKKTLTKPAFRGYVPWGQKKRQGPMRVGWRLVEGNFPQGNLLTVNKSRLLSLLKLLIRIL